MEKQPLLNTFINNVDMNETLTEIEEMISKEKKSYIVAINVDAVMKIENDQYLKKIVDNADMVLVDGKPLVWICLYCSICILEIWLSLGEKITDYLLAYNRNNCVFCSTK